MDEPELIFNEKDTSVLEGKSQNSGLWEGFKFHSLQEVSTINCLSQILRNVSSVLPIFCAFTAKMCGEVEGQILD